jgi:CDP-glycerol glycerophosphotransferase
MNPLRPRWAVPALASVAWPRRTVTRRNRVVMTSFHGHGYRGNTKALFEHLLATGTRLDVIWATTSESVLRDIAERFGRDRVVLMHSREGLDAIAGAGALLFTHGTSDFPYLRLNPEALRFHLYHGLPTKRGEYLRPASDAAPGALHRKILQYRFGKIDHFLSTSRMVSEIFSARFGLPLGRFAELGYPAYDRLVSGKTDLSVRRLFPAVPSFEKVILYAPTYRRRAQTRWFPYSAGRLGEFADFLEKMNAVCCLRPHPNEQIDFEQFRALSDRFLLADQRVVQDAADLLPLSDLVMTDYSSIYLEGLLCDVPCIFLPYDRESYERGTVLAYEEVAPGPIVASHEELVNACRRSLEDRQLFRAERIHVRSMFFDHDAVGAAERVARFLEDRLLAFV